MFKRRAKKKMIIIRKILFTWNGATQVAGNGGTILYVKCMLLCWMNMMFINEENCYSKIVFSLFFYLSNSFIMYDEFSWEFFDFSSNKKKIWEYVFYSGWIEKKVKKKELSISDFKLIIILKFE